MDPFQIAYEISADDYAEALKLLRRHIKASRMVRWGTPLIGLAVMLLPFVTRGADGSYDKFLLGLAFAGAFLFFCGVAQHLTKWNSRVLYKRIGVAGQNYTARFSADDILIESKNQQWRINWAGFSIREECEGMFMFYSVPLMYVFAKRYFTKEQLNSLKAFLGSLPPPS